MSTNDPQLLFTAYVDSQSTSALINALMSMVQQKVDRLTLLINSPGGEVVSGMHVYAMMRALPLEITTHNVGNVDSIANVIFLAGGRRRATTVSTFMFHGVGFNASNVRLEEQYLIDRLDNVRADNARMGGVIAERSNLGADKAAALIREESTRDANWALSNGFIHEICDPAILSGDSIIRVA